MAVWYCSSAAYAAISQFALSTPYTVGAIVRSLAVPALGSKGVYRCTTAGSSTTVEAAWSQVNNGTTTQGTAVFTTVSGQSTYGWGAAAGDVNTVTNQNASSGFAAAGDTIYVSSDHSESATTFALFQGIAGSWNATTFLVSVNRGGSLPPAPGDITSGALITASTSTLTIDSNLPVYVQGVTFATTAANIYFNSSSYKGVYLKNCALQLNGNNAAYRIENNNTAKVVWDNTTVRFANVGQAITSASTFDLSWINTSSAIQGATIPTTLFFQPVNQGFTLTCRGVDLSAVTGTLVGTNASPVGIKALFDSCKIASGVTRYGTGAGGTLDTVELINCYDGTNILNERYSAAGKVTTERTVTLSSGAVDDIGAFSHKMVSNATGVDKWSGPLEGFWFDVENQLIGVSHTATVEIVSSASLNNDDISLLLEYQGASGSPVASFAWSLPATPNTASAAVPTSSATWNSPPSTPVYQHLQATFTPQVAGRVRGQVRLGKISATAYVDPVIRIT